MRAILAAAITKTLCASAVHERGPIAATRGRRREPPVTRTLALALCLAGSAAAAAQHGTPADITIECNRHGAVITTRDGAVYYLGRNCDAARKGGATGRWYLAASAFIIDLGGAGSLRFANDLSCESMPACWYGKPPRS